MSLFLRRAVMAAYQSLTRRHLLDRLDELERTQWWSREDLLALQRDRLHSLLTYACKHVPYYRHIFDQVSFQPDEVLGEVSSLRKLPLLNKAVIRANFDALLTTDERCRKRLSEHTTGGSTGHPLIFMEDTSFRDYFTADVHRQLTWGGWRFGQSHAYIGGGASDVSRSPTLRSLLMDWALNRFTTNAYVLTEESMRAFAAQIRRRRVRLLYGYASTLYEFARFVRRNRLDDIHFQSVSSSAEMLYPEQRQTIEETFGCKVLDRYASLELGAIASECDFQTGMHVSVESVYLEILDDEGKPVPRGQSGHIVVTNLTNYGMPFIRYSIEDIGAWHVRDSCPCGRKLPMMELLKGRRIDMFRTQDGRAVWGGLANPLFGIEGVRQFQLVQKSFDLVVARIVRDGDLDQDSLDTIAHAIRSAMGDSVEVRFEFPDEIPVLDSGKYRFTICELDDESQSGHLVV